LNSQYKSLFSLHNKVAIVTGAAGHLGSAISICLYEFGATVILLGRTEQTLKNLVSKYQPLQQNKLEYIVCDVTKSKDFKRIVENVIFKYGGIDILVNNAYGKQDLELKEITKEVWDHALEMSLSHYFTCTKEVSPYLLKEKSGSIINIASIYGFLGTDQRVYSPLKKNTPPHYSVAKGGILQMTRYFATLWAEKGIRVNAISPGVFPPKKGPEKPDYMHELTTRIPMGRIGQPKDLAGVIILLASDASSYITGQNIVVDGGWSVW
jgi:gluconate 5-dehydrogenase